MTSRKRTLVPGAEGKLNLFKEEVANELGVEIPHSDGGVWGQVPAEKCGKVGGAMIKKMVESFEKNLII